MSLRTKSYGVAIQTKFLYLYFHTVLFVFAICLSHFASEFHILNGTVALICFVVVVFLTASSGLVHPLVLVEDSIECRNPNSITSAGASR